MKYPQMGNHRQYRLSLPKLDGGVNYAVPPHLIGDNQLSDVKNMWFKDGILQTRPGLKAVSVLSDVSPDTNCTYDYKFTQYKTIGDIIVAITPIKCSLGNGGFLLRALKDGKVEGNVSFVGGTTQRYNDIKIVEARQGSKSIGYIFLSMSAETLGAFTGTKVYAFDKNLTLTDMEAYTPILTKGGTPQKSNENVVVEATVFEPKNLLSNRYTCQYTSDGIGIYYYLPDKKVLSDESGLTVLYRDTGGKEWKHYAEWTFVRDAGDHLEYEYKEGSCQKHSDGVSRKLKYDDSTGCFWFVDENEKPVPLPIPNFASDVQTTVYLPTEDDTSPITTSFHSLVWFGGNSSGLNGGTRLFAASENRMYWSASENPLYFPENNFVCVGGNETITGFGKQDDMLVIFKETEVYYTYFLQGKAVTPEQLKSQTVIDSEAARAIFPIIPIHSEIGCPYPCTIKLCNNRLVWLGNEQKIYGLFSANQYNEKNIRELSLTINCRLKEYDEADFSTAFATEFENYYLLSIAENCYALDHSSYGFNFYGSYNDDEKAQRVISWYVWKFPFKLNGSFELNGKVFLTSAQDEDTFLCELSKENTEDFLKNDAVKTIDCFFKTKLYDFGYPERFKRINPFYLQISGAYGERLNLTYFRGDGSTEDVFRPLLTGEALNAVTPMRITPNAVRVREFGFQVDCGGRMEVGSLTLNYSMMGTVR